MRTGGQAASPLGWLRIVASSLPWLVGGIAQGLAGSVRGRPRGGDGDRLAGPGIADLARLAVPVVEPAEPRDGDGLVLGDGIADGGEHARDRAVVLRSGEREVTAARRDANSGRTIGVCLLGGAAGRGCSRYMARLLQGALSATAAQKLAPHRRNRRAPSGA